MLFLQGLVIHEFDTPPGVNVDTGESYNSRHKVQILTGNTLKNGEVRQELLTLNCDRGQFNGFIGKKIQISIGVAADRNPNQKGRPSLIYWVPSGAEPTLLT